MPQIEGRGPVDLQDRRLALVTGANRGIGFAVAHRLAAAGLEVLVGSRDDERGASAVERIRADGLTAAHLVLDITDQDSVAAAVAAIDETFGRLDVLINNAAVKLEFHPSPPSEADLQLVRATYETNVFGTMRMTQAALPLLRRSSAARVVNVSSGLGSLTYATTPGSPYQQKPMLGYNTAKAALNSMSVQFANELRDAPIKVNVADPGYTNTDMTRNDGSRTPDEAAEVIVRLALLGDDGPTGGYFDERGPVPW